MDASITHTPVKKLQPEELARLDRLDAARSSAEGLLTAVTFNAKDALKEAAPGLWQAYYALAYDDDQAVKDVGHLLGLYALLQAPEVLTQALQRTATELAEVVGMVDAFKAVAGSEEVGEHTASPA